MNKTTCPGCSGEVPEISEHAGWGLCRGCGGTVTLKPIPIHDATRLVKFSDAMLREAGPEGSFYFDIQYTAQWGPMPGDRTQDRTHGWADKATRRVVQFG